MLKLIRGLVARFRSRRERPSLVVEVGADGVALRVGADTRSIRWEQVTRVFTYKRDLVMTDEIVLVFEYPGPDGATLRFPVSEEWTGFADLFPVLQERFPGLSPEWYMRVMDPAFATSFTVLYERPVSSEPPEAV